MSSEATPRLLESLLGDPAFRAAFRADPEAALRAAGLVELADRAASAPARKALETLEIRESRSSLAGAMMAVIAEGLGVAAPGTAAAPRPAAVLPAEHPAGAPSASAAGSLTPDDIVEITARKNVAAQQNLESDGPGGGDADHGDGSGEDPSGDENEPDENEPDENEADSGDGGSDGDQDAPGEGSNGEDANDNASDGDSSDSSDSSDSGDSSDGDSLDLPQSGGYPGDSAPPADIALWMGAAAQKRGLPPELPVMASLTESGMRNLNYGDADSVGFFQMRLGVWNNGAYAGYPSDPEKQLNWFLDHAEAVGAQRRARGLSVDDPKQYGEWIADIERPAAQYRGRYQGNFDRAHALLEAPHRGDNGAANAVDIAPGGDVEAGPRAVAAVADARRYLGTPYKWGGSSPSTGFDCSGLVQWAYAKAGIRIPRVTDQQILAANGTPVGRNSLLPGDLVFFRDPSGYVHHVGISLGGDKFINAPRTGEVVRINSLDEPYFAREFAGGRRFDPAVAAGRPHAVPARSAPIDDQAVRIARAALERDAAEARRPGTLLNLALERQERGKDDVQFLPAVKRSQLRER